MKAHIALKYQRATALAETAPGDPSEAEMQALWFGQYYASPLKTVTGDIVEIIQPGNWNHGPGPDFLQAALRLPDGNVKVGAVELHLRAADWEHHRHHTDPAYAETILHVVWQPSDRPHFAATDQFAFVPEVTLSTQLIAPLDELRPLLEPEGAAKPSARPGLCQKELTRHPPDRLREIVHAAGALRLKRKAERWRWRVHRAGLVQALWEALAEALGYHQNKLPMRLIAQRLPVRLLAARKRDDQLALLFGLANLLPHRHLKSLPPEMTSWAQPLWEIWWKERAAFDYAIIRKKDWKLAGIRPLNRPERRLAALHQLLPRLSELQNAIGRTSPESFSRILAEVSDSFWDSHVTFNQPALRASCHLIGDERSREIMVNVFWPMAAHHDFDAAGRALAEIPATENHFTRLARQRVLGPVAPRDLGQNALVQQGLIQIYQDYCARDFSACANCSFPDVVAHWNRF